MQENDQTQNMARPAVVIASIRSGGTFLAHCLSNHSHVFCDRGEPLHHHSVWVDALHPNRRELLAAVLNQTGYHVSMCKLTYTQALHRHIWPWLVKKQPLTIWLRRENTIRQAVSVLINKLSRQGKVKRAQHSFETAQPLRVELSPDQILKMAGRLKALDDRTGKCLTKMRRVLRLTYNDVTGGEKAIVDQLPEITAERLCGFLGVRSEPMRCDLKRINPQSLRELLHNWREVRQAVRKSEFARCLADE